MLTDMLLRWAERLEELLQRKTGRVLDIRSDYDAEKALVAGGAVKQKQKLGLRSGTLAISKGLNGPSARPSLHLGEVSVRRALSVQKEMNLKTLGLADAKKDEPVMMYCTGGIRCTLAESFQQLGLAKANFWVLCSRKKAFKMCAS